MIQAHLEAIALNMRSGKPSYCACYHIEFSRLLTCQPDLFILSDNFLLISKLFLENTMFIQLPVPADTISMGSAAISSAYGGSKKVWTSNFHLY